MERRLTLCFGLPNHDTYLPSDGFSIGDDMTIEQFKDGMGILYEPVPECGCWLWCGSNNGRGGYGQARFEGALIETHRVMWTIKNGQIPDGMDVLHRCDTPACLNPAHLFLGTHVDNMRDRFDKGRYPVGIPANRGELNGMSKLTPASVRGIKALLAGGIRGCDLAEMFDVSRQAICDIKNGRSWSYIENPMQEETNDTD